MVAPGLHSLKEKRAVLRKIKDRTAAKFRLPVAEVSAQDVWQRMVVGFAVVSGDGQIVESTVDRVVGFIRGMGAAEVVADDREILQFNDDDFARWKAGKFA
jgi:uncharacterized protein